MKKSYGVFLVVMVVSMVSSSGFNLEGRGRLSPSVACAADDWKKDFDDVCSRTQDAMSYDRRELINLVGRCDKLKLLIEKLGDTERRFYLKRLQMCRDLFDYALELKRGK